MDNLILLMEKVREYSGEQYYNIIFDLQNFIQFYQQQRQYLRDNINYTITRFQEEKLLFLLFGTLCISYNKNISKLISFFYRDQRDRQKIQNYQSLFIQSKLCLSSKDHEFQDDNTGFQQLYDVCQMISDNKNDIFRFFQQHMDKEFSVYIEFLDQSFFDKFTEIKNSIEDQDQQQIRQILLCLLQFYIQLDDLYSFERIFKFILQFNAVRNNIKPCQVYLLNILKFGQSIICNLDLMIMIEDKKKALIYLEKIAQNYVEYLISIKKVDVIQLYNSRNSYIQNYESRQILKDLYKQIIIVSFNKVLDREKWNIELQSEDRLKLLTQFVSDYIELNPDNQFETVKQIILDQYILIFQQCNILYYDIIVQMHELAKLLTQKQQFLKLYKHIIKGLRSNNELKQQLIEQHINLIRDVNYNYVDKHYSQKIICFFWPQELIKSKDVDIILENIIYMIDMHYHYSFVQGSKIHQQEIQQLQIMLQQIIKDSDEKKKNQIKQKLEKIMKFQRLDIDLKISNMILMVTRDETKIFIYLKDLNQFNFQGSFRYILLESVYNMDKDDNQNSDDIFYKRNQLNFIFSEQDYQKRNFRLSVFLYRSWYFNQSLNVMNIFMTTECLIDSQFYEILQENYLYHDQQKYFSVPVENNDNMFQSFLKNWHQIVIEQENKNIQFDKDYSVRLNLHNNTLDLGGVTNQLLSEAIQYYINDPLFKKNYENKIYQINELDKQKQQKQQFINSGLYQKITDNFLFSFSPMSDFGCKDIDHIQSYYPSIIQSLQQNQNLVELKNMIQQLNKNFQQQFNNLSFSFLRHKLQLSEKLRPDIVKTLRSIRYYKDHHQIFSKKNRFFVNSSGIKVENQSKQCINYDETDYIQYKHKKGSQIMIYPPLFSITFQIRSQSQQQKQLEGQSLDFIFYFQLQCRSLYLIEELIQKQDIETMKNILILFTGNIFSFDNLKVIVTYNQDSQLKSSTCFKTVTFGIGFCSFNHMKFYLMRKLNINNCEEVTQILLSMKLEQREKLQREIILDAMLDNINNKKFTMM
ncbi:hypothetical protein ABPG72_018978 [Tetrahymena utriculariae]